MMQQLIKSFAHNIFVLNNYLRDTFGDHVPYEIIQLIIMSTYPKIKISCGYEHTCLLMDEIYVWVVMMKVSWVWAIIKIRIRHKN